MEKLRKIGEMRMREAKVCDGNWIRRGGERVCGSERRREGEGRRRILEADGWRFWAVISRN